MRNLNLGKIICLINISIFLVACDSEGLTTRDAPIEGEYVLDAGEEATRKGYTENILTIQKTKEADIFSFTIEHLWYYRTFGFNQGKIKFEGNNALFQKKAVTQKELTSSPDDDYNCRLAFSILDAKRIKVDHDKEFGSCSWSADTNFSGIYIKK